MRTDLSFLPLAAHNPGPMTGAGNATYLVAGHAGDPVLVDAGVGHLEHIAALGRALDGRRLARVLVTHSHGDHASGAAALAAHHPDARFSKWPWPAADPAGVRWEPLADEERVAVGGSELVVLHTPGHSPDHLAFWHPESRTALTGDLVIAGSSVMIQSSRGGSLGQYLASLERIRSLNPAVLLPAHGARVEDPLPLLDACVEHRRLRERQVIAALDAGCSTVQAIAETIYHGLDPMLMPSARENVRAHLEQLRTEGRASTDESGRWHL